MVGILILIHHYVLIAAAVFFEYVRELFKEFNGHAEYIVEIKCVCSLHSLLIYAVKSCYELFAVILTCICFEVIRSEHLILCKADLAQDSSWCKLLFGDIEFCHYRLYHTLAVIGVVYSKIASVSESFYFSSEYADACRMEGRGIDVHAVLAEHGCETLPEFVCSLIGKSDSEYIPWFDRLYSDRIPELFKVICSALGVIRKESDITAAALA